MSHYSSFPDVKEGGFTHTTLSGKSPVNYHLKDHVWTGPSKKYW